jgi:hypothetical protein
MRRMVMVTIASLSCAASCRQPDKDPVNYAPLEGRVASVDGRWLLLADVRSEWDLGDSIQMVIQGTYRIPPVGACIRVTALSRWTSEGLPLLRGRHVEQITCRV